MHNYAVMLASSFVIGQMKKVHHDGISHRSEHSRRIAGYDHQMILLCNDDILPYQPRATDAHNHDTYQYSL